LAEFDIQNKLQSVNCRKQAKIALEIVKTNVIDLRLNECLDYLINHIESNGRCVSSTEFKNLSKDYISW
jgi:hypothetical protein